MCKSALTSANNQTENASTLRRKKSVVHIINVFLVKAFSNNIKKYKYNVIYCFNNWH